MSTSDATRSDTTGEVRLLDAGALRALSHPLRIKIFDLLSQHGPQTASSLGEMLGESSGATSYHLRALAKQDLIREVPDRGTARERWWERPHGSLTMSADSMTTPAGRAAGQLVVLEMYRQRNDQMLRYLESAPAEDEALLTTATARLSREQFEELGRELEAVIDRTVKRYRDQKGEGVSPYSIRLDLIPVEPPATHRGGRR